MLIIVVLPTILYKIAAKLQLFFETAKNNCKKIIFFVQRRIIEQN